MFSVIIPTMWRGVELQTMLPLLDDHPSVGEVLLINNHHEVTPGWFKKEWKKVKPYAPNKNIYVNPAFNIGVHHSKFDQICLMQDDNLFDPLIFKLLEPRVTPQCGPIGCNQQQILKGDRIAPITSVSVAPVRLDIPLQLGWAALMFLHKANWYPIHSNLKIHFGENWIVYYHFLKRNLPPLVLVNFFLTTRSWSVDSSGGGVYGTTTSSSSEFNQVGVEDGTYFDGIIPFIQNLPA